MLVKKTSTHLPPERMDLRQSTTQPPHFMPECKFAWAALEVMTKSGNPGSVSAAKSSLSVAQVRLSFGGNIIPQIVLRLLTPARDWRFLLLPEYTGACAGSRSCCPYSALNQVLGSLVGAAILGKHIFVHFKKGLSLLIDPVHILIKIQTRSVWDSKCPRHLEQKAMLCCSSHFHLLFVFTVTHATSFVSL